MPSILPPRSKCFVQQGCPNRAALTRCKIRLLSTCDDTWPEQSLRQMSQYVWRAAIVLLSADGINTTEIISQTGTSKSIVSAAHTSTKWGASVL